jgi:FkbM family methyltransferase
VEALTRLAAVLKRGPLAPLYPAARDSALALLRAKGALDSGFARVIRAPLSVLPIGIQAKLKHTFRPTARLDYPRHKIFLHVDSADALYRTAACRKEPETVRWIEEYVKPGDVLYDVGANVGAYSLIASKHCGGQLTVLAFEPSFATYDELCRNIVLNRCERSILPLLICITEAPGLVTFQHSSLEPGSALHIAGDGPAVVGHEAVYRQELVGFSIDALIAQLGCPVPNHIKIDVDGTELSVLRGASSTLNTGAVRSIQVEVTTQAPSAAAVRALLHARHFQLKAETARGGADRWTNWLFVRP